jgi:hypothetical protein
MDSNMALFFFFDFFALFFADLLVCSPVRPCSQSCQRKERKDRKERKARERRMQVLAVVFGDV